MTGAAIDAMKLRTELAGRRAKRRDRHPQDGALVPDNVTGCATTSGAYRD